MSNVSRIDFNLSIAEHNKSTSNETRIVNASVINGNELPENRNTNTTRTLQKPLTSKSLPNDPLKKLLSWEIHCEACKRMGDIAKTQNLQSQSHVQCMADYVKPSQRDKASHLILHIGTNDLNSSKTAESIPTSTAE